MRSAAFAAVALFCLSIGSVHADENQQGRGVDANQASSGTNQEVKTNEAGKEGDSKKTSQENPNESATQPATGSGK